MTDYNHSNNQNSEPLSGPSPWQNLGAQPAASPAAPVQPETPVQPEAQAQPAAPVQSEAQAQPAAPAQSEAQAQPAAPAQSEAQTQPEAQSGDVPPAPPAAPDAAPAAPAEKPKKHHGKTGKAVLAVLIAAAIVFGAGYGGALLAYRGMDRVVVRESVAGTTADGSTAAAAGLTSEQVAEKTVPSVVAIVTSEMTTNNFWFGSQVTSGAGSGVILSADGYILTNYHVVGTADTIQVELSDGSTHDAKLVASYADGDLAVIKIDATGLTPVTFADSDAVKQGATVYAVGNPEGNFSDSITMGIISALDRTITVSQDDSSSQSGGSNSYNPFGSFFGQSGTATRTINLRVFQFDAAVSPGNSGGGLFDANGELIGIVCAKSSDTSAEGLSFAILGNTAKKAAESLISTGSYTPDASDVPSTGSSENTNTNKAVLGISAVTLTAEEAQQYGLSKAGVYIASIQMQSASDAGLAVGDRIISVDDVVVEETADIVGYLADKNPGDTVKVSVERSGKMISCTVTLQKNSNNA